MYFCVTDVHMRHHGPRPRPVPFISRASSGSGPTPRYKNVTITPSRPGVKKSVTHSVSCGTTTSPPPSPAIPAPTIPVMSTPTVPAIPTPTVPVITNDNEVSKPKEVPQASQSPPTPPQCKTEEVDNLTLMNFEPTSSSSLDYGYEYPQSNFYSAPTYQQAPGSTPSSSYVPGSRSYASESSTYPYNMYDNTGSNVNPFTAAAASNSFGYQNSTFQRPDSSFPPPAYPSQYPSDFYPPPP